MSRFVRQLEVVWRHQVVYPLLKRILRNKTLQIPVDLANIRSILILRFDRLGDMVVTTPILRVLKQKYPHLRIGVFASELNSVLIKDNPHVDDIYILHRGWWRLFREVLKVRRQRFDMVLNFIFNRTTSSALLSNIVAPNGIKIGQGDEKYRFYFNQMVKLTRESEHMVELLAEFLHQACGLALKREDLDFELFIDQQSRSTVRRFQEDHGLRPRKSKIPGTPYVIVNMSASRAERNISLEQMRAIIAQILSGQEVKIFVIASPSDISIAHKLAAEIQHERVGVFPEKGSATIQSVINFIEGALAVVTPDTGIVHFASAVKTPVFGLYADLDGCMDWLPFGVPYRLMQSPKGMLISSIPTSEICLALQEFMLQTLNSNRGIHG